MTPQQIADGNKLIYEYMGLSPRFASSFYHSWDWLMTAVEKIEQHKYEDYAEDESAYAYMRTFHSKMCRINRHQVFTGATQLEAVWLAVVDFIKGIKTNK